MFLSSSSAIRREKKQLPWTLTRPARRSRPLRELRNVADIQVFMFKAVFIPAEEAQEPREIVLSKDGGLEKDALRILAEETFSNDSSHALDSAAQQQATVAELVKGGLSQDRVQEVMAELTKKGGGAPKLGSACEIVCVGLATRDNSFRAVSMYCDGNARFKDSIPVNKRATKLVQAAGLGERIVFGDAFVGRAHDDEECEWQRLDFSVGDLVPDSAWVREAARNSSGKDMNAYTTSGALQSYTNQVSGGGGGGAAGSEGTVFSTTAAASSSSTWSQSKDEVELRYKLPAGVGSKQLTVTIARKSLQVSLKGVASDPAGLVCVPEKVQRSGGAPLYEDVNVGDSTWSIDAGELIITLAKAAPKKWIDVFE